MAFDRCAIKDYLLTSLVRPSVFNKNGGKIVSRNCAC